MLVWLPTTPEGAIRPTIASLATRSASHCFASDTVAALNDGVVPKNSSDGTIRRFTWWDHRGTLEWAQYTFEQPQTVSKVSVYWWDDGRQGRDCTAPKSWRLLYRQVDGTWAPVKAKKEFGTELDTFNTVELDRIETTGLRIEAELQPKRSAGVLEWQVFGG
jgi:hypothetical protein